MAWLTAEDIYLFNEGTAAKAYHRFGAHPQEAGGAWFATWAPRAVRLDVVGDFNDWATGAHTMTSVGGGCWEVFVPDARPGDRYKYRIQGPHHTADKADPFGRAMEPPDASGHGAVGLASIVLDSAFTWTDDAWLSSRKGSTALAEPMSVYEVHLGSWQRGADGWSLSYRDIAEPLARHVKHLGFTHVELMPVAEHPFYGSWGYQVVGYFAPTFRYGTPDDFKFLVNYLHEQGIGVLLDWVPAHFATDPQGLMSFDGTPTFEYDDPGMRFHPDWGTFVFDYGKPGVRSFLTSNALFWIDEYHIDGLRVDAVASMLYRDYSRTEWTPNQFGGRENLEAIALLKQVNESVFAHHPTAVMIAEESTSWPGVSHPTYDGGLGFTHKWNMGWMHDTLAYMKRAPVHRQFHQGEFTFSMVYAYSERYVLPLSHDEVVHGKGSLWDRMPGDLWQKAANLRLLYGYMWSHPGKKLLFMGGEFGQDVEWNHDGTLSWYLTDYPLHHGLMSFVQRLNHLYLSHSALQSDDPGGFEWIDHQDHAQSVVSFVRQSGDAKMIFIVNLTPVPREGYRIGLPTGGSLALALNSDDPAFGGSGFTCPTPEVTGMGHHGRSHSALFTLPPLSILGYTLAG